MPSWKIMFGGYLKHTDGFIIVCTGHIMEKQAINTIPNLLLENESASHT